MRLQNEQVNGRVGGPSFIPGASAAESETALAGGTAAPGVAASGANPFAFSPFSYVAPNMFSGSLFDLSPNTDLRDPSHAERSRRRRRRGSPHV